MGYPRELDEYTDDELSVELQRRSVARRKGLCIYCLRPTTATACKFEDYHTPTERMVEDGG